MSGEFHKSVEDVELPPETKVEEDVHSDVSKISLFLSFSQKF